MSFEIRSIAPDEIAALLVADQRGFGGAPARPDAPQTWTRGELDRTRVAFEAGEMVGVSRTYSFELTMPGGRQLPAAAVSWVSVLPTHRRRGVLTRMMQAMHDDARERGEPAAILTASESAIYGRFGYGVAAWSVSISAERARVEFANTDDDAGRVRLISRDEAERLLPEIYEKCRRVRAGMVSRPDIWWAQPFWDFMIGRVKAPFFAVRSDASGEDDGYVAYGIDGWTSSLPDRRLSIIDMQATSAPTTVALWKFVFGVDLIGMVAAHNLAVDDPLRHIVVDGRRIRTDSIDDHLWLAPLDASAVLAARTYAVPGRFVLEVHDPDGGCSTVAVESNASGTDCRVTTDEPDLACTTSVLGMCALGGNRWSELATAGRLDVRNPEALLLADAMFLAHPAPALLSHF